MNKEQEEELLMHVAAGTDLLTAMAALPRENETPNQPESASEQRFSAVVWIVIVCVGVAALWLL